MYDIHCHLIPAVDDGSDSFEESMEMIELAHTGLTQGIICTPHCNIDNICLNFWSEEFESLIECLRKKIEKLGIQIEIYPGQEVFLTGDFVKNLKIGNLITLNGSDYLLVEFPWNENPTEAFRKIAALAANGYKPIIAHPERYAFVIDREDTAAQLKALGCLLQVNKGSLKGSFGPEVADTAHRLLAGRLADFVASDAHSPYKRTPYLRDIHEMISTLYSENYANYLLNDNPYRVIKNQQIYSY